MNENFKQNRYMVSKDNMNVITMNSTNKKNNFGEKLQSNIYQNNPFKKVIIGSTVGVVGSFSAGIIAVGVSGAYVSGGILFYGTALVVGGWICCYWCSSRINTCSSSNPWGNRIWYL